MLSVKIWPIHNFWSAVAQYVPKIKEKVGNWREHVSQHIIRLKLSCFVDLLSIFRAGIIVWSGEVSSEECGLAFPLKRVR